MHGILCCMHDGIKLHGACIVAFFFLRWDYFCVLFFVLPIWNYSKYKNPFICVCMCKQNENEISPYDTYQR